MPTTDGGLSESHGSGASTPAQPAKQLYLAVRDSTRACTGTRTHTHSSVTELPDRTFITVTLHSSPNLPS